MYLGEGVGIFSEALFSTWIGAAISFEDVRNPHILTELVKPSAFYLSAPQVC